MEQADSSQEKKYLLVILETEDGVPLFGGKVISVSRLAGLDFNALPLSQREEVR